MQKLNFNILTVVLLLTFSIQQSDIEKLYGL